MKSEPKPNWTREDLLALGRSYQGAAVLAAAADFDLFDALQDGSGATMDLAQSNGGRDLSGEIHLCIR